MSEPWMDDAACADMDTNLFFPPDGYQAQDAKNICAQCPVRQQCTNYANRLTIRHGIFGGHTPVERRTNDKRNKRVLDGLVQSR